VPHPRPGLDYPESWSELLDWFPDDAACLAYLERLRWPAGFVCPGCEGEHGCRSASASFLSASCVLIAAILSLAPTAAAAINSSCAGT